MEAPRKTCVMSRTPRWHGNMSAMRAVSRFRVNIRYCFFSENQTRFTNFTLSKLINYTYLTNIWALWDLICRFKAAILFLNVVREGNVSREEVVVCNGCFRVLTPSRLVSWQNIECMPRVERGLRERVTLYLGLRAIITCKSCTTN